VETALTGLEDPLRRYLLELEAEVLEGRSWYGGPGAAELLDWEPVLTEQGSSATGAGSPRHISSWPSRPGARGLDRDRGRRCDAGSGSLWAGLFDLRDNLLAGALEDLRVLSVI